MANQALSNIRRVLTGSGVLIGIVVIALLMAGGCMTTSLDSGQAGVRFSPFGGTNLTTTYGEGLNLHAPWVRVIGYDVRVQEKLEDMTALSNNGLNIGMDVSIRWRPIVADLPKLHTTYGLEYYTKLVQPELRSAVREIVGQYTPEELYSTKRLELQTQILSRVKQTVEAQFVRVEAILIRDVRLPDQIQTAIENKLKEEQEAQRYEFTLQKEKLEADRKRIEAEGEAEYQRIITQQLSPAFLRFKGIEATEKLANSENTKTIIVGSGQDGLPLILGGQ
jgi:regulator of protease activity HflC (stomatin/prohibitin superfamily)